MNPSSTTSTIQLFVYEEVSILDIFEFIPCSFVVLEGISFGYRYAESEEGEERGLERAFNILFEETLKRFRSG